MKKTLLLICISICLCVGLAVAQTKPAASQTQPAAAKPAAPPTAAPQTAAAKKEDCGCDAKTPTPDVYATVNGIKISSKEVEDTLKDKIKELQSSVVEARKRELDVQINTKLLEAEAKKRGITPTKFIEQEILAKVKEPTVAEA